MWDVAPKRPGGHTPLRKQHIDPRSLGMFGESGGTCCALTWCCSGPIWPVASGGCDLAPRVNVLRLNLVLQRTYPGQ